MSKLKKLINLNDGKTALEILVALDFSVDQKSEYHYRINHRLDVWPSSKKFYDIKNHRKGTYDDLRTLVVSHFEDLVANR